MIGVNLLERHAQPHVDAALVQHPLDPLAELLAHLWHHLFGHVEQHELHVCGVEARLLGRRVRQRAQLHDQLGAGVRGADDDDGAPRLDAVLVVVDVGQLELFEQMVTQVDRLSRRLEAPRVVGKAGDVEQPGDRARRQHQPVPRHAARSLLRVGVGDGVSVEVDVVHSAAHRAHAAQRVRQRDGDESGVDEAARDVGQQRRIEHVVDRRDDGDVDGCIVLAQHPGESASALESGEAAADDYDGRL